MAAKKEVNKCTSVDMHKLTFISKNGIKVYPVNDKGKWYIEVDNNGVLKRYPKVVQNEDVNDATVKTINYYYELLKSKENGVNKGYNNT